MRNRVPEHIRAQLPDSVVVMGEKNNILVRSAAVIYVMKRLGGMWFLAASLLSLVPQALRDLGYVMGASVRKAILGTTQELCPLVPTQWRHVFEIDLASLLCIRFNALLFNL